MYPVFDAEMESLGTLNIVATTCFSLAAGAISMMLTLFLENQVSPEATPEGKVLLTIGPFVCLIFALVLGLIGVITAFKRGGILKKIKDEATQRTNEIENAD